MNKSALSVLLSVVYFLMAALAVLQFHPANWIVSIFKPVLFVACFAITLFGFCAFIHPESKNVSGSLYLSPRASKSVRFAGYLLTLPMILYMVCGEVFASPVSTSAGWCNTVFAYADLKTKLEGMAENQKYLRRVSRALVKAGIKFGPGSKSKWATEEN